MRRRAFLGATAAACTPLLAGCSRDGGDGGSGNGSGEGGGGAASGYSMGPPGSADG